MVTTAKIRFSKLENVAKMILVTSYASEELPCLRKFRTVRVSGSPKCQEFLVSPKACAARASPKTTGQKVV